MLPTIYGDRDTLFLVVALTISLAGFAVAWDVRGKLGWLIAIATMPVAVWWAEAVLATLVLLVLVLVGCVALLASGWTLPGHQHEQHALPAGQPLEPAGSSPK